MRSSPAEHKRERGSQQRQGRKRSAPRRCGTVRDQSASRPAPCLAIGLMTEENAPRILISPCSLCGTTLKHTQGGEVGSQSSGGVRMVARLGCGDLLGYGRRSAWDEGAHTYGATPHLWACSPPVSIFDAWPEAAGEVESR